MNLAFISASSSSARIHCGGAGGTIGLKFEDSFYGDNQAGSPNSVWDLELVSPAPMLPSPSPSSTGTPTAIGPPLTPTTPGEISTVVSSGLSGPSAVAEDAAGNLYIADRGSGSILKWTVASRSLSTLVTGLNAPSGVAVASNGDVYFSETDRGNGAISRYSGTTVTTVIDNVGLTKPFGVAMYGDDALLIANHWGSSISIWNITTGGPPSILFYVADGPTDIWSGTWGVAADSFGDIYCAVPYKGSVWHWSATDKVASELISGMSNPRGVAVDAEGNLSVGQSVRDSAVQFPASGQNAGIGDGQLVNCWCICIAGWSTQEMVKNIPKV